MSDKKPIPLNLDWDSPAGKAHMEQMAKLPPDDPVAIAHFENIKQEHPRKGELQEIKASDVGAMPAELTK